LVAARSNRVAGRTGGCLAEAPAAAKLGAMGQTSSTPADVLAFWIGSLDEDGLASADSAARWWRKDSGFDAAIRQTYEPTWERAMAGAHEDWQATAHGTLALVIVLDQFSRNMFRDTPQAFAGDARALAAARAAIARGDDRALRGHERLFLYMPFMHSEEKAAQETCVRLLSAFRDESTGRLREQLEQNVKFAELHRDIVVKWGRFPHRNAQLGRVSSPAELAFLKGPNSAF
jgi:uncharacterized protein (DUF924 family)